jgi:hypothetical protein
MGISLVGRGVQGIPPGQGGGLVKTFETTRRTRRFDAKRALDAGRYPQLIEKYRKATSRQFVGCVCKLFS